MPEVHGEHLDVSAEERRFLRRTFHRFALPWLLVASAIGVLVGSLPLWIDARPAEGGDVLDPLARKQIGEIRSELAALSQRVVGVEAAVAKTGDRLALLEGRSGSSGEMGMVDTDELDRRFEGVTSRIVALESRAGASAGEAPVDSLRLDAQLAALAERLARLENDGVPRANAPADYDRQ